MLHKNIYHQHHFRLVIDGMTHKVIQRLAVLNFAQHDAFLRTQMMMRILQITKCVLMMRQSLFLFVIPMFVYTHIVLNLGK